MTIGYLQLLFSVAAFNLLTATRVSTLTNETMSEAWPKFVPVEPAKRFTSAAAKIITFTIHWR